MVFSFRLFQGTSVIPGHCYLQVKRGVDRYSDKYLLGQITDETDGDPIIKFASGGAKNCGYVTKGGKVECKVRGFTLDV